MKTPEQDHLNTDWEIEFDKLFQFDLVHWRTNPEKVKDFIQSLLEKEYENGFIDGTIEKHKGLFKKLATKEKK